MVGLVIATHGNLSEELIRTAEMIIGPLRNVCGVSVRAEDGIEDVRRHLAAAMEAVSGDGHGIIIMVDMFGGSPANISAAFWEEGQVEILAGVNLPMLLKFANMPENLPLAERCEILKNYGQKSIVVAGDMLKQ